MQYRGSNWILKSILYQKYLLYKILVVDSVRVWKYQNTSTVLLIIDSIGSVNLVFAQSWYHYNYGM